MNFEERIVDILAEAERKLGDLAITALQQRDYAAAQRLSSIAQRVVGATGPGKGVDAREAIVTATGLDEQHRPETPQRATGSRELQPTELAENKPGSNGSHVTEKTYPRFYRGNKELIKVGYSKTDRRTYEHRSPRSVLDRLVAVLCEIGVGGRKFTTEQILPPNEQKLADIPTYQTYLSLAFLIKRGLVQRHGRAGYSVVNGQLNDLPAAVAKTLQALPTR